MSWFQLDPESLAARSGGAGSGAPSIGLAGSVLLGAIGFCLVSVAGFVPWAVFGRSLGRVVGEAGLYAICALVFIALSGVVLHPLILGRGSLGRFYRLFSVVFTAYSAAWIAGWMLLRGHAGSVVGLLGGTLLMGGFLSRAFGARDAFLPVALVLFAANAVGYFLGGWVEASLRTAGSVELLGRTVSRGTLRMAGMLGWGVFYGLGLGAGLGYAFHRCQRAARTILKPPTAQGIGGSV